jgi:hypothetical protein
MESHALQAPARDMVCARCGAAFRCGLGGDCWCAAEPLRLPMPGADQDCVCPACLRAAAVGHAPITN